MTTSGVDVDRTAEIPVSGRQPSFFRTVLTLKHSFLLIVPLPLPPLSSKESPTRSISGVPIRQKFAVVEPPLLMVTVWLAELAQLIAGSTAVTV